MTESGEQMAIRMSILYDVSLLIGGTDNHPDMLAGIVRHFRALMPIEFAWLLLGTGDRLRQVAVWQDGLPVEERTAVPPLKALVDRVLAQEMDDRIDDLQALTGALPGEFPEGMRSVMICPLKRGPDCIGVLILGAREQSAYRKEHSVLLFLLGLQLASVLRTIRLHRELTDMNQRLNLIFSNTDEGFILLDESFCILTMNPPVDETFFPDCGMRPGVNCIDSLLECKTNWRLGKWIQGLRRLRSGECGEFPFSFELEASGERQPAAIYLEFMRLHESERGGGYLVLLRDIGEKRRADDLRRDLTSMLVHDLRSPLGIINWNLELLLEGMLGEVNDRQRKLLSGSIENSRELLDMIDSLLDIDRLESGVMSLEREAVVLPDLARDIAERMEFLTSQMNVSFRLDFPGDFPELMVDRQLVRRILFNLVFNAAKYAPPDSEIGISGSLDWEALEVRLSVADKGPGIPRKYRKLIFDKYVQAEARSRGEIKSKGLGLTFCRLAVEAHDGRIWVESEEGAGSLFHFTLPIVVPGAGVG